MSKCFYPVSFYFLVFYRCIPKVAVDAINRIDQMGLTDHDDNKVNGTEVKEGQRY